MASEPETLFVHHRIQHVALIRLLRTATTLAEIDAFAAQIDALHRAAGRPVILVSLPAGSLTRPSDEIRAAILKRVKERFARGHIELAILVIPTGNLFTRALVRSFFSGARLVLGLSNKLRIADELADAAREVEARCGIKASDVIKAALEISNPP